MRKVAFTVLTCAFITSSLVARTAAAGAFDKLDGRSLHEAEENVKIAVQDEKFSWANECMNWNANWSADQKPPLPAGAKKYVCRLKSRPDFVVLFAKDDPGTDPGSSDAKLGLEVKNIERIGEQKMNIVPTGQQVLGLPQLDAKNGYQTKRKTTVYGYIQAYADPKLFWFWHRVDYPGAERKDRLIDIVDELLQKDPSVRQQFCKQVLGFEDKLDSVIVADEQGIADKSDGTIYFNDPYAVYVNASSDPNDENSWLRGVVPRANESNFWASRKRGRMKNGFSGFGDPLGMRIDQLGGLERIEDRVCDLQLADIRNPFRVPAEDIKNVVLGEEPEKDGFSKGAKGYVEKGVAEMAKFPFVDTIQTIDLSTEKLPLHLTHLIHDLHPDGDKPVDLTEADTYRGMPVTLIWRKPLDTAAKRRRPLTLYNYSNIAISADGKDLILFGIPSRGLMLQFALILKFYYKQTYNKDVLVTVERHRGGTERNDAALENYQRLTQFFSDALQNERWADLKGKTVTLVFGYRKVIDQTWASNEEGPVTLSSAGWEGSLYKRPTDVPADLGTDYVVTLDSDTEHSYHVEVLGQSIRALATAQLPLRITIKHVVVAGSAGYIGNQGNGDPAIVDKMPDQYAFIYPKLLIAEGAPIDNLLAAELVKRKLVDPSAADYLHTSVPSVMRESLMVLRQIRAQKVSSIDMEFAYVRDLVPMDIPVSAACLITDYPWVAPKGAQLAVKSDELKKQSESTFARSLGIALGVLAP